MDDLFAFKAPVFADLQKLTIDDSTDTLSDYDETNPNPSNGTNTGSSSKWHSVVCNDETLYQSAGQTTLAVNDMIDLTGNTSQNNTVDNNSDKENCTISPTSSHSGNLTNSCGQSTDSHNKMSYYTSNSSVFSSQSQYNHRLTVKPFSFEEKDKMRQQRREALIRKTLEEEKKAREFRATTPISLLVKPFKPKKFDYPLTEVTHFELNTERRAKERQKFEENRKQTMERIEQHKKLQEELSEQRRKEEVAILRKQTVFKAHPVRHYKPVELQHTIKCTIPESPKFVSASLRKKH